VDPRPSVPAVLPAAEVVEVVVVEVRLVDEVELRLTREVAARNADEPPVEDEPAVDCTEEEEVDDEPEDELDPDAFDCTVVVVLCPLWKVRPSRRPLPRPRRCGVIRAANRSAPVVPVSRMVRCSAPFVTVAVPTVVAAARLRPACA
jgi:hypothetical protein